MSRSMNLFLILVGVIVLLATMSLFVVNEREKAIKFRLGEITKSDYEPGLYWKVPFINNVRKFDARILTLDAQAERYLTLEKKNVIVDSFVKWRIDNVERYFRTMGGDERQAGLRLFQVIKEGLRDELGKRTIQEAISGERAEIMNVITSQVEQHATDFGIEVVDVRIKRIELPPEVSGSVYRRMEAERARVAKDLRSRGAEAAERIRADADRQRSIILAEAERDAERLRGEGDAKAAEIYANAFTRDESFYEFYRSLTAYRQVFDRPQNVLVLDPSSEFFEYFNEAGSTGQ